MGQVSTLKDLEDKLTNSGPAYIKMTMLKASAQLALQDSAKKAYEAEQLKLKGDTESANFTDKVKAGFKTFFSSTEFDGSSKYDELVRKAGANRRNQLVSNAQKDSNTLLKVAEDFEKQALVIAKTSHNTHSQIEISGAKHAEKTKNAKKPAASKDDKTNIPDTKVAPRLGEELQAVTAKLNIDTNKTDIHKQKDNDELSLSKSKLIQIIEAEKQKQIKMRKR